MARATNSGALTFGLVTVPVKFYVAAKSESVSFNQLTPAGNPVKQVITDKVTGEGVTKGDLIKGFPIAKDQWVSFSKEEMDKLAPEKSKAVEIKEFVPTGSLHPMSIEKTYYLGPGLGGEKAYALFSQVMADKDVVAIAQWTNRTKDHLVAIRPFKRDNVHGLILQQLFYANEVRSFEEIGVPGSIAYSDAEKDMAGQLIDSLAGEYDASKYKDAFSERVEAAVAEKLAGKEITAAPAQKASAMDLLAALQATLAQKKVNKHSA